jgi:Asp-tRNA(Asn)/Glu-tRNA(Gln) amidotransferase A subunit family amidase
MSRQDSSAASEFTLDGRTAPELGSDLTLWPATELAALIRRRAISPVELTEIYLQRIEAENPAVNAYTFVAADAAREAAREAETAVMRGDPLGMLHGLPIAVKEAYNVAGMPTTNCSLPLAKQVADADDPVVDRLKRAGAIAIGKTNMPEFGCRGITDNRLFGLTRSPIAPHLNSLGSSGGSAAAVAGGLAALGHASDGGGSIRVPASACGVFGIKATWGRVPLCVRPNAFFHSPMVGVGPVARTVGDAALMMEVIDGPHMSEPFSFALPRLDYMRACQRDVRNLRVAFCPTIGGHQVSPEVVELIKGAVATLDGLVAGVEEHELPFGRPMTEALDAWRVMAGVESAANDRVFAAQGIPLYDEHRDELTPEFARTIARGRTIDAIRYAEVGLLRTELFDAVERMFENFDLIVGPTLAIAGVENATDGSPTRAPSVVNGQEIDPELGWVLTYPFNLTGHPAASVPAGLTPDGAPVGLQVIGRRFRDDDVFALSAAFERVKPWQASYPSMA